MFVTLGKLETYKETIKGKFHPWMSFCRQSSCTARRGYSYRYDAAFIAWAVGVATRSDYSWAHNYFSGIGKLDGCIAE